MTTAAIHPHVIAGETPTFSPVAPASLSDLDKQHELGQFLTPAEADLLNVALFGHTARQWRDVNPKLEGNVRDYASVEQLLVLANMEGMNAEFIHMGLAQGERLKRLNQIAIRQMQVLTSANLKALPGTKPEQKK